jgi:hypothetical protein
MTAAFTLELDTRAPAVEWTEATGASAGELLRVGYTADDQIARAELRLADRRVLAVTVLADHVEVLLPPDTPAGPATLALADDVGNAATTVLLLDGVVLVVDPPPAPRPPAGWRGAAVPDRELRSRLRAVVRTTSSVATATSAGARVDLHITSSVTRASSTAHLRSSATAAIASRSATRVSAAGATAVALRSTSTIARRDGEDEEAWLLGLW